MPTPFGKYVLLRKIAEGGMAEVFLAKQSGAAGFEKLVVVKRILPHLSSEAEFVKMFVNEARIAARLHHGNVAQIYDLGRVEDAYFIAMEYVNGEDVAQIAKRCERSGRGRLPLGTVARIVGDLCAGLHHAHNVQDQNGKPLGLVHRDVSPQNVLATYEGTVKIIDFGVAKATALAGETRAGVMKGKYAYMSPEQCKGEKIDARSDVFAVGVMLWELTAWQRLFKREADYLTMRAVVEDGVPPVAKIRNDVPPELDAVIAKALVKDRAQRYPTTEAMAEELELVARRAGWDVSARGLSKLMTELFRDKIALQEQAVRDAEVSSVEQVLLKADEATNIDWMPAESRSESTSDPNAFGSAAPDQATAVGKVGKTPPPAPPPVPPPVPPAAKEPRARTGESTAQVPRLSAPRKAVSGGGRTGLWIALGAAVALAVAAAVWVLARGDGGDAAPKGAPAPAPAVVPDAAPRTETPVPEPPPAGPGRLVLRGQEGVDVYLDGHRRGATPLTLGDIVPGRAVVVTFMKRGFKDQRQELPAFTPGEERVIDVALERAGR